MTVGLFSLQCWPGWTVRLDSYWRIWIPVAILGWHIGISQGWYYFSMAIGIECFVWALFWNFLAFDNGREHGRETCKTQSFFICQITLFCWFTANHCEEIKATVDQISFWLPSTVTFNLLKTWLIQCTTFPGCNIHPLSPSVIDSSSQQFVGWSC